MTLVAVEIDWRARTVETGRVLRMLSACSRRGLPAPDVTVAPHAILGARRRVLRAVQLAEPQPLREERLGLAVAGDVRLDNRDELRDSLGVAPGAVASDLELLARGWERWGEELAARLVGDFAFVLWDEGREQLYAARDPFGVRPLYWRELPDGLLLASDIDQLLALAEVPRDPDPEVILEYLAWTFESTGRTFFRGIRAVRPGHFLVAARGQRREVRHFVPPASELRLASEEDTAAELSGLFRRAVEARLDTNVPIVAQLSGGLDSSSVLCMADQIYRARDRERPPLYAASAVFPGRPYDESRYIEAVARHVRPPVERWDGNQPSFAEWDDPTTAWPGGRCIFAGGSRGDLDIARRHGAGVMLSGEGGDHLAVERAIFADLLRDGHLLTAARVLLPRSGEERARRRRMLKHGLRQLAPAPLLWLWDHRRWHPADAVPPWVGPRLAPRWRARAPAKLPDTWPDAPSAVARDTWNSITGSRLAWVVDYATRYAAEDGVELRYPFLDARLARFVLAIPYRFRIPGRYVRELHRRALASLLPGAVLNRRTKTRFDEARVHFGHAVAPRMSEILSGPRWLSADYVDRAAAKRLFKELRGRAPVAADRDQWLTLTQIANLETWLRVVFG